MGQTGQKLPEMSDEFCDSVSSRYIELYEHITGGKFVKESGVDLSERIFGNVSECLARLKG